MLGLKKDISTLSDEALVTLLSTRQCNQALTEIHVRYSKKLLGFFLRMTKGDQETSQDLVQDLFLRILEKHQLFDPSKRFYTWMFAIASNMFKSSLRIRKLEDLDAGSQDVNILQSFSDNRMDRDLFNRTLRIAIENLEDYHRMVFILRYMEELSVKDIAEILEVPEGTIKSRLFYATKIITQSLEEFIPEESGPIFKLK